MKHFMIAEIAGVNRSDVSNYFHSEERRNEYVSKAKQHRIEAAILTEGASKASLALAYLKKGHTLTPMQSLSWFGLHALGQQATKWRARGIDVRNIVPEKEQNQRHAIYKYFPPNTGEQK